MSAEGPAGAAAALACRRWHTASPAQTRQLGSRLASELLPRRALLLSGDLAAGKTVLAQGVAAALGIDPDEVQSPTFTLVREHLGQRGRLLHLDLYRLEADQLGSLGLEELLAADAVKIVEWAERLPLPVPGALALRLELGAGHRRRIQELPVAMIGSSGGTIR